MSSTKIAALIPIRTRNSVERWPSSTPKSCQIRSRSARPASKVAAHRSSANSMREIDQGVSVRIVTYCVQQTGGPTGVYTGWPNGPYPYPAGARPATARRAKPNWPKAAAALAPPALSTALADAKVRGMAMSAVSPILDIAGTRLFIELPNCAYSE
jgi:hypothetical protein